MSLMSRVSLMALGPLAGAACRAAGAAALSDGAASVGRALAERFTDHSSRAAEALAAATDRAWAALERVLKGESVLTLADRADDRAFRDAVRAFGAAALAADPAFAPRCLAELRAARAAGLLTAATVDAAGDLTKFGDPAAAVREQWALADAVAADLRAAGFATLASFVALRPPGDAGSDPLLAVAARYYFRRLVEDDPKLFRGLTFSRLEVIGRSQEGAASALAGVAARLEALHDTIRDQDLPLAEEVVEAPEPSVADRFRAETNGVLAVSPDGSRVLGGSKYDGKLRLFDSRTGKELRRLPGHAGWVTGVAFSPDGARALSAGRDGAAKLWDVATGKLHRAIRAGGRFPSAPRCA